MDKVCLRDGREIALSMFVVAAVEPGELLDQGRVDKRNSREFSGGKIVNWRARSRTRATGGPGK